eukprot:3048335-Pleurochrysis_carterae.AAC.4
MFFGLLASSKYPKNAVSKWTSSTFQMAVSAPKASDAAWGMDPADVVYARWCSDVCQRRCCDRTWIHPAMMLKAYPRPSNPGSAPSSGHVARVRAAHARLWAMYGQIPWGADANSIDALCSQCQHVPNKTWATREATSSLARPRARQRRRRP